MTEQQITRSVARRLLIQAPELRAEVLRENEDWLREQYNSERETLNRVTDTGAMWRASAFKRVGKRFFGWEDEK